MKNRTLRCNNNCGGMLRGLIETAYGDYLCPDCWDDYICTDRGRLEYLLCICRGDYPASEFDADFLRDVAESWKQHRDELAFTDGYKKFIEAQAVAKGLL